MWNSCTATQSSFVDQAATLPADPNAANANNALERLLSDPAFADVIANTGRKFGDEPANGSSSTTNGTPADSEKKITPEKMEGNKKTSFTTTTFNLGDTNIKIVGGTDAQRSKVAELMQQMYEKDPAFKAGVDSKSDSESAVDFEVTIEDLPDDIDGLGEMPGKRIWLDPKIMARGDKHTADIIAHELAHTMGIDHGQELDEFVDAAKATIPDQPTKTAGSFPSIADIDSSVAAEAAEVAGRLPTAARADIAALPA